MPGNRRSIRLPGFHYRGRASYFVTTCTSRRARVLARVAEGCSLPTPLGGVVLRQWQAIETRDPAIRLDEMVVMPDHVHGILHFGMAARVTLPRVVAWFKGTVVVNARRNGLWDQAPLWQRGYFERVIRTQQQMDRTRVYIRANPTNWIDP